MKLTTKLSFVAASLLFATAAQAADKTLHYCTQRSPQAFSPVLVMDGTSYNASSQMVYNRLVEFKRGSTEIEPALAESWTVSEDGLEYNFKLRQGVKFHANKDFKPSRDLNADDVVFSFNRQLDPNHPFHKVSNATYPYFRSMKFDKLLKSVEKVDDANVKITLNKPDATFLSSLGMDFTSIYSAEYAEFANKQGKPELIDTTPIGTGPFIFDRYQVDQKARYFTNKDYWNGRADFDQILLEIVPDATTRSAKLQKGECDLIEFPNQADLAAMEKDPNIKLHKQAGMNVSYIAFNNEKTPFDNVKVRQALNMAVDKKAIIDVVYLGAGLPAKNPLAPTVWGYNDNIEPYPHDIEKAKALLAEAGFPNGFETTLWVQPVVRSSNPNPRRLAELIQADWEKIGVKAKLETIDWADYTKRGRAGDFPAAIYGWSGDNGDPDNFLSPLLSTGNIGNSNYARFSNKDYDAILDKAITLSDKAERTKLYEQAQEIIKEQAPWIPVAHSVNIMPTTKRVNDYKQSPFGYTYLYGIKLDDK
ncbi:peptide transporter [Pasteurellaceae bacterium RH1A]|nr:peptide transporter [Pasteurellaceae bacterium RH1A]